MDLTPLITLNVRMEGMLRVLSERDSMEARAEFLDTLQSYNDAVTSLFGHENTAHNTDIAIAQAQSAEEDVYESEQKAEDEALEPTTIEQAVTEQEEIAQIEATEHEQAVPEPIATTEPETKPEPEAEQADVVEIEPTDEIRVDEMISRREAADLRKAFTINDKYRFRRELFGNDEAAFADTINLIMAMNDYAEAQEYIYHDLGLDPENEDVIDFMAIISAHFQ